MFQITVNKNLVNVTTLSIPQHEAILDRVIEGINIYTDIASRM